MRPPVAFMSTRPGPRLRPRLWGVKLIIGEKGPLSGIANNPCRDFPDEPLARLEGVTVLFTADHGQVDVAPDRVDYLDELWPELDSYLTQAKPAGSARDVFLHVREPETVIAELSTRLGDRAEVRPAASLFDLGNAWPETPADQESDHDRHEPQR